MSFILFLLNPFIGFIDAMKALDRRFNGLVFIAFYALFGYAISFNLTTADSYRIAARFCQVSFDYREIWKLFIDGSITDVYLLFVYGLIQSFTRNPKVLFGVLGAVMGVFSYLSIRQLYEVWKDNRNRYFYFIVLFFFLSISFFNVNGIRFWTATSVYSFFAIRFLYFRKRGAIAGVLITPFIHFGFIIAVFGFVAFLLADKLLHNTTVFYFLLLLTFGISLFAPRGAVSDIIGAEGDVDELTSNASINRKATYYVRDDGEEYDDDLGSDTVQTSSGSLYRRANSLFTKTFDFVNKIGMVLMLSLLYVKRKTIMQSKLQSRFFNFVLFSFSLGFLAVFAIHSGTRFIRLANMMYAFWLCTVFRENVKVNKKWKSFVLILFVINFYALSFFLFNSPRLVTPKLWLLPPIMTILDGIGFAPIDFI